VSQLLAIAAKVKCPSEARGPMSRARLIGVSRESGNRFVLDNALAQNSIQIR
jgi:hypothetical protein